MKIDHEIEGLDEFYAEAQMTVRPTCQPGLVLGASAITVDDVCEGFQGEDIVTYECPLCGLTHRGTVYRT